MSSTFRRRRLSERNKTAVMLICTPTGLVWPLLTMHLIALTIEGTIITLMRRDRRVWREIYGPTLRSTLGSLVDLCTKRNRQQAKRRTALRNYLSAFTFFPNKLRLLVRHGVPSIR